MLTTRLPGHIDVYNIWTFVASRCDTFVSQQSFSFSLRSLIYLDLVICFFSLCETALFVTNWFLWQWSRITCWVFYFQRLRNIQLALHANEWLLTLLLKVGIHWAIILKKQAISIYKEKPGNRENDTVLVFLAVTSNKLRLSNNWRGH